MQTRNRIVTFISVIFCSVLFVTPLLSQSTISFSGRVYNGDPGVEPPGSTPIQGVKVILWGTNTSGVKGTTLDDATTDGNGWYGLSFQMRDNMYNFYIIEEVDPVDYHSMGATSVVGTILSPNLIEFTFEQLLPDLTGNKFWDKPNEADIEVRYGSVVIPDGSTVPSASNGTDFGSVDVASGYVERTYTIENIGTDVLNITGVTLSGSGDFTVTSQPVSSVPAGASTTCTVRFDPGAAGLRSATVNIANGTTKNPYDFAVQGTGTETPPDEWDFGDAPEGRIDNKDYNYPTTLTNNGARHRITQNGPWLGDMKPDAELDGQPDIWAESDDLTDDCDEGGHDFTGQVLMGPLNDIHILVGSGGMVDAWVDFNRDGIWQHPVEQIHSGFLNTGDHIIPITVPANTMPGFSYARVRISTAGGLSPEGPADDGEIIDQVTPIFQVDFGDAPDSYGTLDTYNWIEFQWGGQCEMLGTTVDGEFNGQPGLQADGDDTHGSDDEDGVTISPPLVPNHSATVQVVCTTNLNFTFKVIGYIDFNCDGDFDSDERMFEVENCTPTTQTEYVYTQNFQVPANAVPGPTYARFRIARRCDDISITGPWDVGEVEDYKVTIDDPGVEYYDFGDAPSPYPSASHLLGGPWIGDMNDAPDAETGMQRDPHALGDDNDGRDDENGLVVKNGFLVKKSGLNVGFIWVDFTLGSNGKAFFKLWIDKNGDNDWNDSGELIPVKVAWGPPYCHLTTGLGITLNNDAIIGKTMARVRIWSDPNVNWYTVTHSGPGGPGEVEDFEIEIRAEGPGFPDGEIIFGRKWNDENGNGVWDTNESQLVGWTIWLDLNRNGIKDAGEPETQTDIDGYFFFPGLQPGTYEVHEELVGSWAQTFPGNPDFHTVDVDPNQPSLEILFGNKNNGTAGELDFGDAPALYFHHHAVTVNSNLTLGKIVDSEPAAFSDAHALGDDQNNTDDEDGVVFKTPMIQGQTAYVQVDLTNTKFPDPIFLFILMDFNKNGSFWDAGEIVVSQLVTSNTYQTFPIPVPASAKIGATFARFRIHSTGPVPPTGYPYGEIEDYAVEISNHQTEPDTGIGAVKWSQPPVYDPMLDDTTSYWGWDEGSIYSQSTLADDWFCHDPRPVTSIRWWGAYADWDSLFAPPMAPEAFQIGVWTDVSDDAEAGFSHPGEMVMEWFVNRYSVNETIDKTYYFNEFMDEPSPCFRYTFYIPENDWFYQEGDSTVYWLSIAPVYEVLPDSNFWGWLTREHYFNDDAVRVLQPLESHPGDVYVNGGMVSDFRDLAFELGTDEYQSLYDFGDAPDLGYGATLERNGPQHLFDPAIHLGELIDSEPDGQPTSDASGDDHNSSADEDGILFMNDLIPGDMAEIQVTTSTSGYLNAWIDFHGDTKWNWPFDFVFTDVELEAGTHSLQFPVIENATLGSTIARFRFSTWPKVYFRGYAGDGEVEDYQITIGTPSAVEQSADIPKNYNLYQNYPNPFNPRTSIGFEIPATGSQRMTVQLDIYNLQGQHIRTLVHDESSPGHYQVEWEGLDDAGNQVSTGIYLLRMKAGTFTQTKKLIFQK